MYRFGPDWCIYARLCREGLKEVLKMRCLRCYSKLLTVSLRVHPRAKDESKHTPSSAISHSQALLVLCSAPKACLDQPERASISSIS